MSILPTNNKKCVYLSDCSGCSLWQIDYSLQLSDKKKSLEKKLKDSQIELNTETKICGFEQLQFRDRTDVSLIDGNLGFYRNDGSKKILDILHCELFSKELQSFFSDFREVVDSHIDFLKELKISFRLRVSPIGDRGVWIDTSHENTKKLLEHKTFLEDLLRLSIVEVGQKFKRLTIQNNVLKLLKDPIMHHWMNSFDEFNRPLFLYSTIGAFTQPGNRTNELLIHECITIIKNLSLTDKSCLELFSGMGNFTLMLLSLGFKVTSVEVSKTAFSALSRALENHLNFKSHISFKELSLYNKRERNLFNNQELLIVDPPRSGLGFVIDELASLEKNQRPKHLIYISCLADTLVEDLTRLSELGYGIDSIVGVDQFAYSNHCEWISYLRLS